MRNPLEMFSFGNQALTKIFNSNTREGRVRQEKGSHRASGGRGVREGHLREIHTLLVQAFPGFLSACSTDATTLGPGWLLAFLPAREDQRVRGYWWGSPYGQHSHCPHLAYFPRGRRRSKTDFIDSYMPGKSLASTECALSLSLQLCFRAFLRLSGEHW